MRHLVVKALHRDQSFLARGASRLEEALEEAGIDVVVRDLYKEGFNPVLTTDDFEALKRKEVPEDILHEQECISSADFMWFVFPIWWASMPAILKGYIDRVFLSGFAYQMQGDYPIGMLNNKKVVILNSMGMSHDEYTDSGMFEALNLTIDRGIFQFSGLDVVEHKYFSSILSADNRTVSEYLKEIEKLALKYSNDTDSILNKTDSRKVA